MQMQFKELFLFSVSEKLGRRVGFSSGINLITSRKEDGTNRGKSVIMRSLYYALGAETFFEKRFDLKNKVFILHFVVDEVGYYVLRTARLYKVFNEEKKLLFVATKASEFAKNLMYITHFAVMLPNRTANRLEITPPVYNYLPYFLDQDCYSGSKFSSFDKLAQYDDYKVSTLFYHWGVYTFSYFEVVQKSEQIAAAVLAFENRVKVLSEVLADVSKKLEVGAYSGDMDALKHDVGRYQRQYSSVVSRLNESKTRLIKLRNSLSEFQEAERELSKFARHNESEISKLLQHRCPECNSIVADTLQLRGRRYNLSEDIQLITIDVQSAIHDLNACIVKEETKYAELLGELDRYDQALKINTKELKDILRYKGLCEVHGGIVDDLHNVQMKLDDERLRLDEVKKELKRFDEQKANINKAYYELLMNAKTRFGLDEIDPESLTDVKKNFGASGSDACIATIIWYMAIIELRNRFNPDAIRFPIVFDSPNNVENDDQKTQALFKYLFEKSGLSGQFIMSGIGFDEEEFLRITPSSAHIEVLKNAQYHLLQKEDYDKYSALLMELLDAKEAEIGLEDALDEGDRIEGSKKD